ncbi:hypothetical protein F0R75_05370 [Francisella marina]|uniref:Uncharacterized protein n=1 Tax=Francisella marina TaxID=2249302 RepID=A0ABX5ZET2_9GAMM|nr:hypothetical protein F0R74_01855 [Francisella marina]QEO59236.1 hypothetical protein F0R75_05370 [Francisella marina]
MLTAIFNYRVHLLLHLLDFKSSELPTINRLLTFCYYSIVPSYKTRHHIITKNPKITSPDSNATFIFVYKSRAIKLSYFHHHTLTKALHQRYQ